jgi:hypothetical protein
LHQSATSGSSNTLGPFANTFANTPADTATASVWGPTGSSWGIIEEEELLDVSGIIGSMYGSSNGCLEKLFGAYGSVWPDGPAAAPWGDEFMLAAEFGEAHTSICFVFSIRTRK